MRHHAMAKQHAGHQSTPATAGSTMPRPFLVRLPRIDQSPACRSTSPMEMSAASISRQPVRISSRAKHFRLGFNCAVAPQQARSSSSVSTRSRGTVDGAMAEAPFLGRQWRWNQPREPYRGSGRRRRCGTASRRLMASDDAPRQPFKSRRCGPSRPVAVCQAWE